MRLTVTDLNAPMLEIARTKFAPREEVEFEPADAMALPFADGSFEAVVCQFGLMFFPDKDKSYREVHRVLKPGGRYFFSVWDRTATTRLAASRTRSRGASSPRTHLSSTVPFSCHRIDPIKEAVLAAGFADFNASVVSLEKVVAEWAAFARGLVYGNPLIDQIRAPGGEPERVVEAVLQKLRLEFGADPGRMPLQAIMFSASKLKIYLVREVSDTRKRRMTPQWQISSMNSPLQPLHGHDDHRRSYPRFFTFSCLQTVTARGTNAARARWRTP